MSRQGRRPGRDPDRPPQGARAAALRGLVAVERGRSRHLREVVDVEGLAPRDRRLAWELAQGTERTHLTLDFVLSQFVTRKLPEDPVLRSVVRLGAYQLLYLTRIPPRAALNETVGLLRDARGFANAVLRKVADHVKDHGADASYPRRELPLPDGVGGPRCFAFDTDVLPEPHTGAYLAVRYGLPGFLVQRFVDTFGFATGAKICAASHATPGVVLRATPRLADRTLPEVLAAEGVKVERVRVGAAGVETREEGQLYRVVEGSPFATDAFRAGLCIAQDPTAFAAAQAVGAQPGEIVLDLCAAPGTKTTVLAEAVAGGRVLAFDVDPRRRERIAENVTRLGLTQRVEILEDLADVGPVDRVLVDVPCSNTGVLARRVEVRRWLREATFENLRQVQIKLLAQGLECCRAGGIAVYSTCSVDPMENRQVVDEVLSQAPNSRCRVVEDRLTLPEPALCDGGYHAVIEVKRP